MQVELAESQNVRSGQVMKVPFVSAVVAVTQLVDEDDDAARPSWQVVQTPFGELHSAHEASHARQSPAEVM